MRVNNYLQQPGIHLFIWFSIVLLFFSCTSPSSDTDQNSHAQDQSIGTNQRHPNIIYILADDLGYGDIQAYQSTSRIPTPNLDLLAQEGMMFLDAHSPSSVCTPTRYGILTGRYAWRSRLPRGVLRGYGRALISPERETVASILQKSGYHTGVVGKWHLGLDWVLKESEQNPLEAEDTEISTGGVVTEMNPQYIDFSQKPSDGPLNHGFNYSFILPASLDMDPYCYLENDQLIAPPTNHTPGNDLNTGYTEAFWRAGRIALEFEFDQVLPTFCEKAINFIEESTNRNKPFFLYVPFAAPHTPWVPTAEFHNLSQAGNYGDFVHMVDDAVGKILATIDQMGIKEQTIVIFTSDNGPFWTPELISKYEHKAAANLRGMKADAWEGGHRVPFIVRWPGKVQAGSQTNATTSLTNLFHTVSDIVGIAFETNPAPDSYSILPVLLGKVEQVEGQEAVIHHSSRGFFAIRKDNWKLIVGRGSGGFSQPQVVEVEEGEATGQLYDLSQDIGETNNLYAEYPEKVEELTNLLEKIRAKE